MSQWNDYVTLLRGAVLVSFLHSLFSNCDFWGPNRIKNELRANCMPLTKIFFDVYLCFREGKRETECEWGRGRERETQNLKQAPGSEMSAQSPIGAQTQQALKL